MKLAEQFFDDARERYLMMLKRKAGQLAPWSKKPEFNDWHLCNVHREDDRTTRWFAEHIRPYVAGREAEATIAFRWFNRIETAEIIKDLILDGWPTGAGAEAIKRLHGVKPVVTGAYIVNAERGYTKLGGVVRCIDVAVHRVREGLLYGAHTLEETWRRLKTIPLMGPFSSYEVASDLRWMTLQDAPDIMTWANAGPGCTRGLSRVVHGEVGHFTQSNQETMLPVMQELLSMSLSNTYWPAEWKHWEMREVEHWLCEFDKLERARQGAPLKRRYKGGKA